MKVKKSEKTKIQQKKTKVQKKKATKVRYK
jgi:hypothetical protein